MTRANLDSRVYEGADVIDSRDVIERIEELQGERETACDEPGHGYDCARRQEWDEDEDGQELKKLLALQDEASSSPDWQHGEALIADGYFEEYAQELAEDIGAIQKGATWPNDCIDWEEAASRLKQDYYSVTYGETEYWIRA